MDEEDSAPEITKDSAELVAWDEPLEALGHQVPNLLSADEQTLTERLVLAGDEEADTELREASYRAAKA